MSWSQDRTNFNRNIAVIIGINDYQNGIHHLSTPVNDATVLADLLETEYEYQQIVRLFPQYKQATLENINELLKETLPNQIRPTQGDRLLFYFAGHGVARNSEDGPAGYLIPQDAHLGQLETFLPMRDLNAALSQLDCHHLLVILDCCFAGNFRWSSARNVIPVPETIHREHYDRFIRFPAWQAITSAAHNQEALDFFSDSRDFDKKSANSPFALALIEGLKDNKADLTGDGVITAPELYLYLRNCLIGKNGISELQTPGLWPLQKHDRGEFIFTQLGFNPEKLTPAPPLNEDNNPYRGLQPFDEKHARFFFGRQELVEELYKRISQSEKSSSQLTVAMGISGCGKSSLVKAGLIPYIRKNNQKEWYILEPMRPSEFPFTALARTILAIANETLTAQLEQINFLNTALQEEKAEQFEKLATIWSYASLDKKLLLLIDRFEELKTACCNSNEEQQLEKFKNLVQDYLKNLITSLQTEPQKLINIITDWSQAHLNVKLLLVIDQFEELVTMSRKTIPINQDTEPDANKQKSQSWLSKVFRRQLKTKNSEQPEQKADIQQEWQQFLTLLTNTLKNCPQLHIVLTLRSDFEPKFVKSAFQDHWDKARFLVRAMRADELREIIEKPASEMALYFEPVNLVDRLIDEAREMPGALPLLSFTLSELYIKLHQAWVKDGKEDRVLTVDDKFYQQGGIAGYLTYRADEIYNDLPDDDYRATMRRVMLRMVEIQGGKAVRRQVPESEFFYSNQDENRRREEVIKNLLDSRLVVKGKESEQAYVEPAHDFLVRGWSKLQEWQEQAGKILSIEVQRRLNQAANDWSSNNHTQEQQGLLWNNDPRLPLFEQMLPANELQQYKRDEKFQRLIRLLGKTIYRLLQPQKEIAGNPRQFNERELEFLLRSVNLKHERLGQIFGSVIFVVVLVTGLSGLAWILRGQAVFNEKTAVARQLAAQSQQAGNQQILQLRALLAVESMQQFLKVSPSIRVEADNALRNALSSLPLYTAHHSAATNNIVFSPDGKYFATASDDKTAKIWDVSNGKEIIRLPHEAKVNDVAFSPDSKYVATASSDKTARLWKTNTGREVARIFHKTKVSAVKFSPNGKYFATLSNDRNSKIWDTNQVQKIAQIPGGSYYISGQKSGFVFSPDSKYFINYNADKIATLWNMKSRQEIFHFFHKSNNTTYGSIDEIAFSPNGKYLVTAGTNITKLWDISSGKEIITLSAFKEFSGSVLAFSPDSKYLAIGTRSRGKANVRLLDVKTGEFIVRLPEDNGMVQDLAFSPDGKYLAIASDDKTAKIWNIQRRGKKIRGKKITDFYHESVVKSVTFSPDSRYLATTSRDTNGRSIAGVWDITKSKQNTTYFSQDSNFTDLTFDRDGKYMTIAGKEKAEVWKVGTYQKITSLRYDAKFDPELSPNGKYIATVSKDKNELGLWNSHTAQKIASIPRKYAKGGIRVTFSPDDKYLATIERESIQVWKTKSGKKIAHFQQKLTDYTRLDPEKNFDILSLSLSSDARYLAVGSWNEKAAEVWDVKSRQRILRIPRQEKRIINVQLTPDGQYLATSFPHVTVRLWQVKSNEKTPKQLVHNNSSDLSIFPGGLSVLMQFTPDGQYLFTSPSTRISRIWETKSGKEVGRYPNLSGKTRAFAFSQDGKYIVIASRDGTARVWDIRRSQEISRITYNSPVKFKAIQFTPDNKYIISIHEDNTIELSLRSTQDLITEVCLRLNRNFTWDEWRYYFGNDLNQYRRTCPNLPIHSTFITETVESRKIEDAIAIIRRLLKQNLSSNIDPTLEARRLVAPALFKKAEVLFEEGNETKEAINAYTKAEQFDPTLGLYERPSWSWYRLCWYGMLHGHAAKVKNACEKALALDFNSSRGSFREARGVVKALTGDTREAILDFQAAAALYKVNYNKYQKSSKTRKNIAEERYKSHTHSLKKLQTWIDSLRAGHNPFTKEEIKTRMRELKILGSDG